VFAGAVIQPDATIGAHSILNTAASVDHDCIVGDFVHIGPGVTLCGGVTLDEGVLLGVGAKVAPNVEIGPWSTAGAGAVCVVDVRGSTTVVGVPARPVEADA
jgi:acetyltransferase EpsM